ncbi:hypothetical protein BMETH_1071_0 [methanotrophic bacterial endosymbiont of Bathymodiolus sp.]|nr:hypothetical protein BMETH_1071_0 [methanotrophic bacterial endosymbiont of Bathymodiolus sp.]
MGGVGVSSPRPWGCFLMGRSTAHQFSVFLTPVGVFPWPSICFITVPSLPHARGGVS